MKEFAQTGRRLVWPPGSILWYKRTVCSLYLKPFVNCYVHVHDGFTGVLQISEWRAKALYSGGWWKRSGKTICWVAIDPDDREAVHAALSANVALGVQMEELPCRGN